MGHISPIIVLAADKKYALYKKGEVNFFPRTTDVLGRSLPIASDLQRVIESKCTFTKVKAPQ